MLSSIREGSNRPAAAATDNQTNGAMTTDEPRPTVPIVSVSASPADGSDKETAAAAGTELATPSEKTDDAAASSPEEKKEVEGSPEKKENGSADTKKKKRSVTATGVSYVQMIHEAIAALRDVRGSSRPAIAKWIQTNYPATIGPYLSTRLSQGFKTGEQKGRFLKIRGSYKISSQFKAAEKKKAADAKKKKAAAAAATASAASAAGKSPAANSSSAKSQPAATLDEVKQKNAEKLAQLTASGEASAEALAKARRNMRRREEALRKKEEEEQRAKERAEILRRRRFPMEDTRLHAEDAILGIKPKVPARPALPSFWQLVCNDGRKLAPAHQAAARVENWESGSRGLVPDLLQVYHFWRGDVQFSADGDEQLVPDFTLQNLIYATNEILVGNAKKEHMLPPLITHLFCASLSVLLTLDVEESDLSPALKRLFKDLRKYLHPVLTPASWADVCSLYMDAMQRYYSTDASLDNVLPALNTDMNYLLGRSDTPLIPMTPAISDRKRNATPDASEDSGPTRTSQALPDLYCEYLGSSHCVLNRAYFKLLKSDPWLLSAEELMAILRCLADDILAFCPRVSENLAKREGEMQDLLRNKRVADMNFRKARLAFEGPKKPVAKKAGETNDDGGDGAKDADSKAEEEFKPSISRKQFETAMKAQQKASDAYEKGIRKLVARTQPVGYDRHHNAIYCFRHDPEVLYVEEIRPASASAERLPEDCLFPRSTWQVIHKTSLFDAFVGSLDTRGKRENDLSDELLGPSGTHQSLRRFLEDDVKEKAEVAARKKEKEALLKKLEIAKLKCDEDMGRRSGRLAGQAEDELCQVEGEILAFDRIGESDRVIAKADYEALAGGELMRKFDSLHGIETRRAREKKESSKSRATFECSKLVSSGNIDGTGIVGMLVADVLELEEMCQSLVPLEGAERLVWITKLENAVVGWSILPSDVDKARAATFSDKQGKRESIDSAASTSKRRRIESPAVLSGIGNPASNTFHTILTCLKSSIVELSSRIADVSNTEVAIQDLELADDNMSVDESNDDAMKKEKLELQWKKLVHRIRKTPTKRHVQIRELLVEALAAARKAHLPKIVSELRMALLQYHPNAAGDCKYAAVKVLEENGGYDESYDDDVEGMEEVDDEEVVDDKEADAPTLLAADALVIAASLGGSGDEATRKDWVGAVKSCRTMARLASLTKGFVQAAKLKLSKLQEEQEDLAEALTRWEKEAERKVKKLGRPPKSFEGPSEVWTNVEITNEICMAKTENYPWWPSKKCIPKDAGVAERLAKVDRCLVSLFGEMGSLRVVKNDSIKPFTGEAIQDDVFAGAKKDMRTQLEEFIAMARRLQRALEKKSASNSRKR